MLRKQMLLLGKKKIVFASGPNIIASRKQILLPKRMVLSLATMEAMLTSAKFCPDFFRGYLLLCVCVALCFRNNVSFSYPPGQQKHFLASR